MMNNDNEKRYMELTAHTEQAICELMERSTTLKKAQRDQQISMAHGVLSLWARLARDLSTSLLPEFSPKVEADHRLTISFEVIKKTGQPVQMIH